MGQKNSNTLTQVGEKLREKKNTKPHIFAEGEGVASEGLFSIECIEKVVFSCLGVHCMLAYNLIMVFKLCHSLGLCRIL